MSRFFGYLARFAAIVFGFFCGSLAASAFLHVMFLGMAGQTGETVTALMSGPALASVPLVALFIGYFAFLPSLPFIAAAEAMARRDWLFYALSGGGVALVVVGAGFFIGTDGATATGPFIALVFVAAGLVAGIAYWLVAGRSAGRWLHGADDPSAPTR